MTMQSPARSTTSLTEPSAPSTLLSLTLEVRGAQCRLRAIGAPLRGIEKVHEWRFTSSTLTASLLNEVGATVDDLAVAALLLAVGIQLPLALELQGALGDLRDDLSDS
jgi:hypothetical protein